ncbi:class I histocompatibility antigen, F10 alpha chain-like isoform X2 [Boleophthalmus pectinirostris]|uniref:class I histocompatibility antigen, F10 alpha chain-like isoform X2 n=1 Tax=Boleophthalmus pectinirostris TaxID=150288 RepID=UPI00243291F4|nr:class I histocompatibility antigen, F10 alpha chain-like isoform X2 [Boleophthalmus pectinirostris]
MDMKWCFVLVLVGTLLHGAAAKVHTLRFFQTSSTQVPNFPEHISVGYVDDLLITHYDSVTKREVPKQEWMNKITEEDPQYWERNTQVNLGNELVEKENIKSAKRRLNVTGGLHINQYMYGCDWDDETNEITGYYQFGFDGEDFISLDFETETFVAPKQQAFSIKQAWEMIGEGVRVKTLLIHRCAKYLKKFVLLGESALKRTELPLVSLLQKSSSGPVTCHATRFYPDRAMLFWTKDGVEVTEDVDPGEILPNGDGTFQTSVSLDLSSVPPEDWDRFNCVFQLSGLQDDYVTRLDRAIIMTNEETPTDLVSVLVPLAVVLVLIFAVAFVLIRRFRVSGQNGPRAAQEIL